MEIEPGWLRNYSVGCGLSSPQHLRDFAESSVIDQADSALVFLHGVNNPAQGPTEVRELKEFPYLLPIGPPKEIEVRDFNWF